MSATIPMPGDVAELIGSAAEGVENRSLLLDKYVFHKKWPITTEQSRQGPRQVKWDEASRWSFMRITDGAESILRKEANEKQRKARGRNLKEENQIRLNEEAEIAKTLANITWESTDNEILKLRTKHTRRFLGLIRNAYRERSAICIGQLEGRLAINLADSLIQNAGICLDRLFGLPYIPGSAIKGVCRHAALANLMAAGDEEKPALLRAFCATFGTSSTDFEVGDLRLYRHLNSKNTYDQKGAISFLPAYPINEARVVVDLTNVHYPDYYKTGNQTDLAKENPRPNPFPAVEIGAQFAFTVLLNGIDSDHALLDHAFRWLESALTINGLGAKTASGYGWFSLKPEVLEEIEETERLEVEKARRVAKEKAAAEKAAIVEAERKASLPPEELAYEELSRLNDEEFASFAKEISEKEESWQRAFISLLRDQKEKRQRWKTWKKKKKDLAERIRQVCNELNLPELS